MAQTFQSFSRFEHVLEMVRYRIYPPSSEHEFSKAHVWKNHDDLQISGLLSKYTAKPANQDAKPCTAPNSSHKSISGYGCKLSSLRHMLYLANLETCQNWIGNQGTNKQQFGRAKPCLQLPWWANDYILQTVNEIWGRQWQAMTGSYLNRYSYKIHQQCHWCKHLFWAKKADGHAHYSTDSCNRATVRSVSSKHNHAEHSEQNMQLAIPCIPYLNFAIISTLHCKQRLWQQSHVAAHKHHHKAD